MERCDKCGYGLSDCLGMSYQTFVKFHKHKITQGLQMINGSFKEKGTDNIITGDIFHCLVSGNAQESYKTALEYFNFTRRGKEKEREVVSALWIDCKKGEEQ